MKKQNEIGFNNFKSFGEKIQTFSQKPITLVYGPNSVGKSSLLHFMLYIEYLKSMGQVDLMKSHFAGDPLDLGGFNNFIHKRNTESKINYQLTFYKESDISRYFSPLYSLVKGFEKEEAFASEIGLDDIKERIQRYRKKKKDVPFIYGYEARRLNYSLANLLLSKAMKKEAEELGFQIFQIENSNILPSERSNQERIFHDCLKAPKFLEDVLERNDNQKFDGLDKLILFLIDYKEFRLFGNTEPKLDEFAQTIRDIYKFLLRVKSIKKVKIEFEFGLDGKEITSDYRYFLDNELIYTFDSKSDEINQNNECSVLALVKESGFVKFYKSASNGGVAGLDIPREVRKSFYNGMLKMPSLPGFFLSDSFSHIGNTIHWNVLSAMDTSPSYNKLQYLGPLRYHPERFDLIKQETESAGRTSRESLSNKEETVIACIHRLRINRFVKIPLLLLSMRKLVFNNTIFLDLSNIFRRGKNKISSDQSMNSEKMWSMFIDSVDSQDRVNQWLSNDINLKTPYRIETKKSEKHSLFRKFFKLKPITTAALVFIDKRNNTEVTPREMGLGVSQFLPILITTQTLKDYKIFVEQPELHLHPAVQCEIADEIIRSMKTQNNEFIIESHSEHLLLRIMKRMRQTSEGILAKDDKLALTPDDICLLYVDNNGEMTHVNELELDEDGSLLDPWPNGFFEEGFKERFA